MSWTLSCNNKTFTNKLSAIREQVASSQGLYFHTPKAYNNYDFTIEPKLSLGIIISVFSISVIWV